MKLKYTTKVFIVVNLIAVVLRTVQIMFLTDQGTGFLKDSILCNVLSTVGTVIIVLAFAAMYFNASQAVRQPEKINCKGLPSAAVAALTAVAYLSTGIYAAFEHRYGWGLLSVLSALSAVCCLFAALSAVDVCKFPKAGLVSFTAYWLLSFVLAYLYYTERPLRVRTVTETAALCFIIFFFIAFGKAACGVKSEKNFRKIYPLGLVSSGLCILSVVPELIAKLFRFGDKVTASAVNPVMLSAAALFIGFFTINTFKKSNTIHPKQKKRLEMQRKYEAERKNVGFGDFDSFDFR